MEIELKSYDIAPIRNKVGQVSLTAKFKVTHTEEIPFSMILYEQETENIEDVKEYIKIMEVDAKNTYLTYNVPGMAVRQIKDLLYNAEVTNQFDMLKLLEKVGPLLDDLQFKKDK